MRAHEFHFCYAVLVVDWRCMLFLGSLKFMFVVWEGMVVAVFMHSLTAKLNICVYLWAHSPPLCFPVYICYVCMFSMSHTHMVCIYICSVLQLCPTLCNPMDWSPPGSSLHEIFWARILEWVAISSSSGSSQPGIEPIFPCLLHCRQNLYLWDTKKASVCVCVCVCVCVFFFLINILLWLLDWKVVLKGI